MNNEQFRRLILDQTPARDKDQSPNGSSPRQQGKSAVGGATPGVLGSRMRSSIPMTPYVDCSLVITMFCWDYF